MSSFLSDDIVFEVLSRLPVKSILRFKCVCKPWCNLISNPNFPKMHYNQKTFALVDTALIDVGVLGDIITVLEEIDIKIIGLKMMSVTRKFAATHVKIHENPEKMKLPKLDIPVEPDFWVEHLRKCPVVALLLEGRNAISLAAGALGPDELSKRLGRKCCGVYCSDSSNTVKEDTELWFNDKHDKWSDEYLNIPDLTFFYRKKDSVLEASKENPCFPWYSTLLLSPQRHYEHSYEDDLIFVLIRPAAIKAKLVGKIIHGLEYFSFFIAGLKLVNKKDIPESFVWGTADSTSSKTAIDDDDDSSVGVAIVVQAFRDIIVVTENGTNHCNLQNGAVEIDSNLIYKSNIGESAWEFIRKCFPFGFVVRNETHAEPILEASLNGLVQNIGYYQSA